MLLSSVTRRLDKLADHPKAVIIPGMLLMAAEFGAALALILTYR